MTRSDARLEELARLVPDVEEFETLLLNLVGAAVPDPRREWDSSSGYSTFDKRIVSPEITARALAESEASIHRHVSSIYADLTRLLDAFWSGGTHEPLLLLVQLGERLEADGRIEKARRCYDAALSLALPFAEKKPQILALRRIGRVALAVGNFPESLSYYQRSTQLARDSDDLLGEVIGRTGLGNVRLHQGRWGEAYECYRSALALSDRTPEFPDLDKARAQLFNNLGNTATRLGQLDEGEEWFGSALECWEKIVSPTDLAICYHNVAHLRKLQGRLDEAIQMYIRALTLPIVSSLRSVIATDVAMTYVQDGNLLDADMWSRQAEEHAIGARSPYSLGFMYQGRGRISLARGEEDGFTFFEKALEIAREKGYTALEAETLVDYAEMRMRTGGAEEAQAYLEHARKIFEDSGAVLQQMRAEELLAQLSSPPLAANAD